MARQIPLLPTLIVAAAVATMIALGFWQLQRRDWKEGLIARYQRAQTMSSDVPWPRDKAETERSLFRWSGFNCQRVLAMRVTAASNVAGRGGVAQIAQCAIDGGGKAEVALGWSLPTQTFTWNGSEVRGIIGPGGTYGAVLHAGTPAAGLQPLALPDPSDLPNNHLAYAVQWFLFAFTATVIYGLALRKRLAGS